MNTNLANTAATVNPLAINPAITVSTPNPATSSAIATLSAQTQAFSQQITEARKQAVKGHRERYKDDVMVACPLIITYLSTEKGSQERKEMDQELDRLMKACEYPVQKNTSGTLKITKIVFENNSDRCKKVNHFGIVAHVKNFKADEVERFYNEFGTPQDVWENYNKDGSDKVPPVKDPSKERAVLLQAEHKKLATEEQFKGKNTELPEKFKVTEQPRSYVAIIELNPDGGYVVRRMVYNNRLLDDALLTTDEPTPMTKAEKLTALNNLAASATPKDGKASDLNLEKIRKDLGNGIGDACKLQKEHQYAMWTYDGKAPKELDEYNSYVRAADISAALGLDDAHKLYEDAHAYLMDEIADDSVLQDYLDKPVDDITELGMKAMPRVKNNDTKPDDTKNKPVTATVYGEMLTAIHKALSNA